jgi:hypothetical protein
MSADKPFTTCVRVRSLFFCRSTVVARVVEGTRARRGWLREMMMI